MKKQDLGKLVEEVYCNLRKNNFATLGRPEEPMWDFPMFGIAAGNDPYFDFLKEHIGSFHWSPLEIFKLRYKDSESSQSLRVVSFAFPQTMITKASQAKARQAPSREWIVTRGEWEPLMQEFSGKLVGKLDEMGIRSVSTDLQHEFTTARSEKLGIASKWSHRHGAYAAGLGTFGLSDGLITEKGKAVRFTTLIVEADITITKRPYQSPYEWCLYHKDGSCGVCMKRCPAASITQRGHDKDICDAYEEEFATKFWPEDINRGDYILGCGLCQAGVPCQNKKP